MTREEAISYFHKFMDNEPISIPTLEKAMQVAIKALEQEPVEPVIESAYKTGYEMGKSITMIESVRDRV
jgi:hypothetical protein